MSSDSLGAKIRHADAAADESPPEAGAVLSRDLADLVAVIERLEALMASDAAAGPNESAAVERIADIAFVLHEREVEPSLCDALDAAVRDISGAGTLKQASAQRTQEAAELLRELSRRVTHMMALAQAEQRAESRVAASQAVLSPAPEPVPERTDEEEMVADEEIPDDVLFAADLPEDDEFAQVVAALAEWLPAPDDEAEPPSDLQPDVADIAAQPLDRPQSPEPTAQEAGSASAAESEAEPPAPDAAEMPLVSQSGSAVLLGEFSSEPLMSLNSAGGQSSGETSAGEQQSIEQTAREQALCDLSSALLPCPPVEEGRADAKSSGASSSEISLSEIESNEASSSEHLRTAELATGAASTPSLSEQSARAEAPDLPAPDATPANSSESLSAPGPEQPVELGIGSAFAASPLVGEGGSEAPQAPPGETAGFAQGDPLGSADHAVERLVDHDVIQRDVEREAEMYSSSEPVGEGPVRAVDRGEADAENADEIFQPIAGEPLRALLPEAQPAIDPDEDPGDLFEPIANAPVAVPIETAMPVAAPPQPSNVAPDPEHIPPPSSENEPKLAPSAPAVLGAPGAGQMPDVAAPENSAPAPSLAAKPDAKPPAPPAPPRIAAAPPPQQAPRPVATDPLAPVRALSEEELIALFS